MQFKCYKIWWKLNETPLYIDECIQQKLDHKFITERNFNYCHLLAWRYKSTENSRTLSKSFCGQFDSWICGIFYCTNYLRMDTCEMAVDLHGDCLCNWYWSLHQSKVNKISGEFSWQHIYFNGKFYYNYFFIIIGSNESEFASFPTQFVNYCDSHCFVTHIKSADESSKWIIQLSPDRYNQCYADTSFTRCKSSRNVVSSSWEN